jgi:hypothetical protein
VSCKASRFWRTAALRMIPLDMTDYLSGARTGAFLRFHADRWDQAVRNRKICMRGYNKP